MVEQGIVICERYKSGANMDKLLGSMEDDERRDFAKRELRAIEKTKKSAQSLKKGGSIIDRVLIFFGLIDLAKKLTETADSLDSNIAALEKLRTMVGPEAGLILEVQIRELKIAQDDLRTQAEEVGTKSPTGLAAKSFLSCSSQFGSSLLAYFSSSFSLLYIHSFFISSKEELSYSLSSPSCL